MLSTTYELVNYIFLIQLYFISILMGTLELLTFLFFNHSSNVIIFYLFLLNTFSNLMIIINVNFNKLSNVDFELSIIIRGILACIFIFINKLNIIYN
jgi:hypothetical protein